MEEKGRNAFSIKLDMIPLDGSEILDPISFLKNFPSLDAFREWTLKADTLNDLRSVRDAFEKAELYEHTAIIQDTIDKRMDVMLKGLGFEIE